MYLNKTSLASDAANNEPQTAIMTCLLEQALSDLEVIASHKIQLHERQLIIDEITLIVFPQNLKEK